MWYHGIILTIPSKVSPVCYVEPCTDLANFTGLIVKLLQ